MKIRNIVSAFFRGVDWLLSYLPGTAPHHVRRLRLELDQRADPQHVRGVKKYPFGITRRPIFDISKPRDHTVSTALRYDQVLSRRKRERRANRKKTPAWLTRLKLKRREAKKKFLMTVDRAWPQVPMKVRRQRDPYARVLIHQGNVP